MTRTSLPASRTVLALLLLGATLGCKKPAPAAPPLAHLVESEGAVLLARAPKPVAPAAPGPLFDGDLLTTGPDGRALLRFADGQEIEIDADSRFQLTAQAGAIALNIEQGIVLTRAGKAGGAGARVALSILTPFGLTRLGGDEEARFAVTEAGTNIEVRTGEITFVNKDGSRETARSGDTLEVALGTIKVVKKDAPPPPAPEPPKVLALEPIEVRLSAERGTILVKPPGAKRFERVGKAPSALVAGTEYKVGKNARAQLAGDGLGVTLESNTAGGIGESVKEGDSRRFQMRLDGGTARFAFMGGGPTSMKLASPQGELTVRSSERTFVSTTQTKKGTRVDVHTGSLQVELPSGTREIKAGETAEIAQGEASVSAHRRSALQLAGGKPVRVYANDLKDVALLLPKSDGELSVEVASEADFEAPMMAGRVAGDAVYVVPPRSGNLHWRFLDAKGEVVRKGLAQFQPDSNRSVLDLDNPHSEVADTGQKAMVYFQSVLPSLTFSYPPIEGAKQYRLRVFKSSDLKSPLVEKTVDGTRAPVEAGKLAEGEYVWHAAPLDAAGAEMAGGRMNKLEITYDNAMESLAIARPRNGELVGAEISARGVAPLGSKLFVNGKGAPVDEKGRFEVRLAKTDQIVFRLVSGTGSESYWVRNLRVRR